MPSRSLKLVDVSTNLPLAMTNLPLGSPKTLRNRIFEVQCRPCFSLPPCLICGNLHQPQYSTKHKRHLFCSAGSWKRPACLMRQSWQTRRRTAFMKAFTSLSPLGHHCSAFTPTATIPVQVRPASAVPFECQSSFLAPGLGEDHEPKSSYVQYHAETDVARCIIWSESYARCADISGFYGLLISNGLVAPTRTILHFMSCLCASSLHLCTYEGSNLLFVEHPGELATLCFSTMYFLRWSISRPDYVRRIGQY